MDTNNYIHEYETETTHNYHPGSRICARVMGVTFDGRQSVIARLSIGEEILLKREPTNPYDCNAILVERMDGQQIGYLNRHLAATLAQFFDAYRQPVRACVHCISGSLRSGYSLGVVITFNIP